MYGTADDYLVNLLRHYIDGGGAILNGLDDFDSEHAQRSHMPLELHSCQGVPRAGDLSKQPSINNWLG